MLLQSSLVFGDVSEGGFVCVLGGRCVCVDLVFLVLLFTVRLVVVDVLCCHWFVLLVFPRRKQHSCGFGCVELECMAIIIEIRCSSCL